MFYFFSIKLMKLNLKSKLVIFFDSIENKIYIYFETEEKVITIFMVVTTTRLH
jgi:hypothetical protein